MQIKEVFPCAKPIPVIRATLYMFNPYISYIGKPRAMPMSFMLVRCGGTFYRGWNEGGRGWEWEQIPAPAPAELAEWKNYARLWNGKIVCAADQSRPSPSIAACQAVVQPPAVDFWKMLSAVAQAMYRSKRCAVLRHGTIFGTGLWNGDIQPYILSQAGETYPLLPYGVTEAALDQYAGLPAACGPSPTCPVTFPNHAVLRSTQWPSDPRLYVFGAGECKKWWIETVSDLERIFDETNQTWADVKVVPVALLEKIPTGGTWRFVVTGSG